MKKVLIDPRLKWCKANLHCHTNQSDGFYTPSEIKKHYMEQGYSIVAFSDHEMIFDNSYLMDESFVALTATEYSISLPSPNGFRDVVTIHMNLFSKDPHNLFHPGANLDTFSNKQKELFKEKYHMDIPCDNYQRVFTQESIQEVINRANSMGFLVQFNHPNWSLNIRDDYMNLKGLWALEIFNYLTEIETGAEYCPNIYDDMLRHGHKLYCTMGDDNHNYQGSFEGSFGGITYIGVESLTYDNVYNAMKNGNLYCTMGPIIKELSYDNEKKIVHVECSEVVDIILVGYNRTFYHVYGKDLTHAEFILNGQEKYFRIAIKDKYGRYGNTHAYYLDELDK